MALKYQPVTIPLALGLDTRRSPNLLGGKANTTLQNYRLGVEPGALSKRFGRTVLTQDVRESATNTSAGRGLYARQGELVLADQDRLLGYDNTSNAEWVERGVYLGWGVTSDWVSATDGFDPTLVSGAVINGIRGVVWDDQTNTFPQFRFYSEATSAELGRVQAGDVIYGLKTYALNDRIFAVGGSFGSNDMAVAVFDTTDLESSLASLSVNYTSNNDLTNTHGCWDSCQASSTQLFYAYRTTAGDLEVGFIGNTGTFGSSATVAAGDVHANGEISCFANSDGTQIVVLYRRVTTGYLGFVVLNGSLSVTNGPTSLYTTASTRGSVTGGWLADDSEWYVYWHERHTPTSGTNGEVIKRASRDSSAVAVLSPGTVWRGFKLASDLFLMDGSLYVMAVYDMTHDEDDSIQSTYFLMDAQFDSGDAANALRGMLLRGDAELRPTTGWLPLTRPAVSSTAGDLVLQDFNGSVVWVNYNVDADHGHQGVAVADKLLLGGTQTWEYDRQGVYEHGFHLFPENVTSSQGTAGSLTQQSTYTYRVRYEFTDAQGRRSQSPGVTFTVALTGANDDVTLTIPTLQFTRKQVESGNVYCAVYRSEANGTQLYRLGTVLSTQNTLTVSYADTASDASITSNELDEGNTGELDAVSFPSTRALAVAGGRVWAVANENRRRVLYSKLLSYDGPIEFNDALSITLSEEIRGIGEGLSSVLLFGERNTHLVAGAGPDDLGVGAFSEPVVAARGVGLESPKTLVQTPVGWAFLSSRGFVVIDEGGQQQYIGAPVRSYESETFVGAVAIPDDNEIRWATASGTMLVYNYETQGWSVFSNRAAAATVVADGVHYWVNSSGAVSKEDSSVYTDSGTEVLGIVETGWITPENAAADMHVRHLWLVGEDKGDGHSVQVEVAYDYGSYSTLGTFAATEFPRMKLRTGRVKCQAIRFKFTEVADGSPAEGYSLVSLGLEMALEEGTSDGRKVAA